MDPNAARPVGAGPDRGRRARAGLQFAAYLRDEPIVDAWRRSH
jgi:hypothetical protein